MPDRPGHHHRHRFPAEVIARTVWLYPRFALSVRDVEALLYERAIRLTYETVRAWVAKFGAVDEHGQVLDVLVQERRDTAAAERFFRRLPELAAVEHRRWRAAARLNNRVERSHQPTRLRERQMRRFTSGASAQRFLVAFSRFGNYFRVRRHLLTAAEHRTVRHARYTGWRALVRRAA